MKRHSEKGMALVITLMMLAIVTFMAVVFLSLSRRERTNVTIAEEQRTARYMADAALARAKADMTATMNNEVEGFLGQATNAPIFGKAVDQQHVAIVNGAVQRGLFKYDLRTSKNFINPNGFKPADGAAPWNVSYVDKKGVPLDPTSDNFYRVVANLQYDPRPPVVVKDGKTNDFRYYLDLNRNGMFDQNDLYDVINYGSRAVPFFVTNRFVGDPEWIGVLERPDLPHSETNRFIGRYAYIMMPTGKSLDINFIHNMAVYDQTDLKFDGSRRRYSRNQGVGSWELNLAAFLVDLHTNVWKPNTTFYNLNTNLASGIAFKDAVGLLQYRFNNSQTNLFTPREIFGPAVTNRWAVDLVDMDSDGPIIPYQFMYNSARPNFDLQTTSFKLENDRDDRYWQGADRAELTGEFPDVQRYFKLKTPAASAEQLEFYQNFTNAVSSARTNLYDRFAYYRLLSQMGADSRPALQNRIHLNFVNEPGTISTNLLSWVTNSTFGAMPTAIIRSNTAVAVTRKDGGQEYVQQSNSLTNFFLIAANAMLRESLVTNVFIDDFGKWRTNYTIGCSYFHDPSLNTVWQDPTRRRYIVGTPVRPDISITNIQIFHRTNAPSTWRPNDQTYTNAEYTAAVHRILQLAANIYDSMTNNAGRTGRPGVTRSEPDAPSDPYFPTVFRPLYDITPTNILIVGWEPQATADFALRQTADIRNFRSPAQYFIDNGGVNITNVSFYGQPWVIGAKKGWPNFNEFSLETVALITRKLEILKDPSQVGKQVDTNALQTLADHTRQVYMVGFSNTFGIEAWNSYIRTNQRQLRLTAEIQAEFGVERVTKRDTNGNVLTSINIPLGTNSFRRLVNSMTSQNWPGRKGDMDVTNAFPNFKGPQPASGGSDFRVPIFETINVLTNSQYTDSPFPRFYTTPARFESLKLTPDLRINVTNRIRYLMVDVRENRVIDYVTLDNIVSSIDLDTALKGEQNPANEAFGAGGFDPSMFWVNTAVSKTIAPELTQGVMRQIEISLGLIPASQKDWKDFSASDQVASQIKDFIDYMNGVSTNPTIATNITRQVPFSPMRHLKLNTAYQANDPFVHYTIEDLRNPAITTRPRPFILPVKNEELGKRNTKRQAIRTDGLHGVEFQDPRIFESDDWQFPIAKLDDPINPNFHTAYGAQNFHYRFPNIGALGQIHRGTPWQTVYLKAMAAPNVDPRTVTTNTAVWVNWAGSYATHPTNDWKLVGLFTTAMTENAARGLLSVNQSGTAAWSAVLSGVPVITNSLSDAKAKMNLPPQFGDPKNQNHDLLIQPASPQLTNIVRSINQYRAYRPMGVFSYLGEVLGVPALSYGLSPDPTRQVLQASPFLHISDAQVKAQDGKVDWHEFTDDALEAIPQRILSLLKEDEPRVTIYCFGQTLKPAPRSYVTSADFYNLCVNYQVTGEYVTKAVVRVEGEFKNPENPLRTVVESFEVLAPFE